MSPSLARYGTQNWLDIDLMVSLTNHSTKWLLCDHIYPFDNKRMVAN